MITIVWAMSRSIDAVSPRAPVNYMAGPAALSKQLAWQDVGFMVSDTDVEYYRNDTISIPARCGRRFCHKI